MNPQFRSQRPHSSHSHRGRRFVTGTPRRDGGGSFPSEKRSAGDFSSRPRIASGIRTHTSGSPIKRDGRGAPHAGRGRSGGISPRHGKPYGRDGRRKDDRYGRPKPFTPFSNGTREKAVPIPPLAPETIRIIPLGGVEEIGRNMTVIEYGEDIVIVDCGIQFRGDETPGIDFILPNTKYVEERRHKVRALIITHGHLDHIGGIPYIAAKIGNPPIYTRNLTMLMIKKRQEEFPHLPPPDIRIVEKDQTIKVGGLEIAFFSVTHTIPDSMGIIIRTPHGSVVHTGDLKLDHENGVPTDAEEQEYEKFKNEKVLVLLADSTNVERPGFSIPERVVFKNIEEIIKNAHKRIIVGTFASQIERIAKIIEIAEKYDRKVVVDGRSMRANVDIARTAGVLSYKKETSITPETMSDYPPSKIVALVTGAQGDEYAVLMRMANKSHKYFTVNKDDLVVLSSSIIPGNERSVQKLKDNLSRQGAQIVHYQVDEVHSSGHANRDETRWIHRKIKPKFFVPIHGYHYMLRVHVEIAKGEGTPEQNILIPDNGMVIEIEKGEKISARKETAPKGLVLVDGFSVGDMQEVVIRDRQMLSQDGMFVIVVTLDVNTGTMRKSPDLISRGFVYLRESQELLKEARMVIKKTTEQNVAGMRPINFDYLKNILTDTVSEFLFRKTNKRPIVIPVILGI